MGRDAFHLVPGIPGLLAHFGDGVEDFAVRAAAPIAVGFRSGFFVAGEFADGLVHRLPRSIISGSMVALRAMPTSQNRDMGHPAPNGPGEIERARFERVGLDAIEFKSGV